ncbi:MAG: terminase, partial [Bdellovibrionales bacterium]|nr:terminase [Bdellovibrionales bacterium]
MASNGLSLQTEQQLAEFVATFYDDPYGFVMAIFPWGEPTLPDGSANSLADKDGPEDWQREILEALGEHIRINMIHRDLGLDMIVWRSAIASGHGVGKSALVAWIIYFLMSTRVDTRMAVTASTQFQLEDKTWPELGKWHALALNKHWFRWTATTFSFAAYNDDKQKNYRATAATVSETNTEAFAGLHNEGKSVAVVFDEASGVLPKIWEVA